MRNVRNPVVIDFSHQTSPFEELWPTTHRALLPVIGKPIIVHTLELLRNRGYRHFRIARHLQQPFVKNRLGNGQEWGVRLRYSDLTGPELLAETVACYGATLQIIGDELLNSTTELQTSLAPRQLEDARTPVATGLFEVVDSGLGFYPLVDHDSTRLGVRSVRDYHRLSFELCKSFACSETAPGAVLHRSAQTDWKASIAPDALIGKACFVGKHCKIDAGAVLEENCVLGNGVYLDRKSKLRNCVVLPNTYIGRNVGLRDCVVSPKGAIHINGAYADSAISNVLRSTRPNQEALTGLPSEIERLMKG